MAKWKPRKPRPKTQVPKPKVKGPHPWLKFIHGMPMANGGQTGFLLEDAQAICQHLEKCGLAWGPDLAKLADENGNIHVSQLPTQQIKQLPPEYGPDIWVNQTGEWVPIATDEPPKPEKVVDLSDLTDEQAELVKADQAAIAKALKERELRKIREAAADPHVQRGGDTPQAEGDPE